MTEESTWTEYAVACADGLIGRHVLSRVTVRADAIAKMEQVDAKFCGPHSIKQRMVTRIQEDWGPVTGLDPLVASRQAFLRACEQRPCTKCDAEIGQPCINLTKLKGQGLVEPTLWPHNERQDLP